MIRWALVHLQDRNHPPLRFLILLLPGSEAVVYAERQMLDEHLVVKLTLSIATQRLLATSE